MRTSTEAFVPVNMHMKNMQVHCIGRTRPLHVFKMNRITTRASMCNTRACDQQGHLEYVCTCTKTTTIYMQALKTLSYR